jgi:hypothetical protein
MYRLIVSTPRRRRGVIRCNDLCKHRWRIRTFHTGSVDCTRGSNMTLYGYSMREGERRASALAEIRPALHPLPVSTRHLSTGSPLHSPSSHSPSFSHELLSTLPLPSPTVIKDGFVDNGSTEIRNKPNSDTLKQFGLVQIRRSVFPGTHLPQSGR